MRLPLVLSDSDWRELDAPDSDSLGQRTDMTSEQALLYRVMRRLERRSEWACHQNVMTRNLLLVVILGMLSVNGADLVKILLKYLHLS